MPLGKTGGDHFTISVVEELAYARASFGIEGANERTKVKVRHIKVRIGISGNAAVLVPDLPDGRVRM